MEIVRLSFVITEDDLNSLIVNFVTVPPKIRDLHARVIDDRISLAGVYESILPIRFDTRWKLLVANGKIAAHLADVKSVGVGLGFLKGYILRALSSNSTFLELVDESLVCEIDRFIEEMKVPIKTNLTSVSCENGCVWVKCGT